MTAISWLLEFVALIVMVTGRFITRRGLILYFAVFDMCLGFIIIPIFYLLNTDVNRGLIAAEGWCQAFKKASCLRCIGTVTSTKVGDIEAPSHSNLAPSPISTVSGNINSALHSNQGNNKSENVLENDPDCILKENRSNLDVNNAVEQNSAVNPAYEDMLENDPDGIIVLDDNVDLCENNTVEEHSGIRRVHEYMVAVSYTHLTLPTICSV